MGCLKSCGSRWHLEAARAVIRAIGCRTIGKCLEITARISKTSYLVIATVIKKIRRASFLAIKVIGM